MLLLHGMRDAALSWDIFAHAMSSEYRVLSLDSRGHGDSDRAGPNGYRFGDYITDIEALADHLDLRDMIIVGHSAGGRYAWDYAVKRPHRVRALVIVDIDPDPYNPQTASDLRASVTQNPNPGPPRTSSSPTSGRAEFTPPKTRSESRSLPLPPESRKAATLGRPT